MKKQIILIITFIIITTIVQGIEICEDTVASNETCYLITPVITCTNYTYTIYNNTGNQEEFNNLTPYNTTNGLYQLNFTQNSGTYKILLCDNTTREIYVEGNILGGVNEVKGSMAWIAVALLMVCMTGFLGFGANMIRDKGLIHIKRLLFYMFIVNSLMLGVIAFIAGVNAFDPTVFRNLGLGYASINIFIILAFTMNYSWLTIYKIYNKGRENFRKAFNGGRIK